MKPCPRSLLLRFHFKLSATALICVCGLIVLMPAAVRAQSIELVEFVPRDAQEYVRLAFKIHGASKKRIRVAMTSNVDNVVSEELSLPDKDEQVIVMRPWKNDQNTITIIGFVNDDPQPLPVTCSAAVLRMGPCPNPIQIRCQTRWCKEPYSLTPETLVVDYGKPAETSKKDEESSPGKKGENASADSAVSRPRKTGATEEASKTEPKKDEEKPKTSISISKPKPDGPIRYQDVGEVPVEIRVAQKPDKTKNIKNVSVTVLNDETGPVDQTQSTLALDYPDKPSEPAVVEPKVRVKKGSNDVTFFDPKNRSTETVSLNIICDGPNCGEVGFADTSFDRFSSIYTRGIVGFEQSGGSAAASVQKPFLEFFWNPPISTSEGQKEPFRYIYPRASMWGSVKLTSVPQQVSSQLATFAPSFLSPINEGKVNELVQGFDFLVGTEFGVGRGFRRGDIGTAFLPTGVSNTKQKYSAYLITGFGAISPLSPKDTVQLFVRPGDADLEKLKLKGLDPKFKFLAFASPDRDSFFRQYYAGIRIKSHFFKQNANGKYEVVNRPGGMFDITFGQNEAVTGGRLIGSVLRFDGFYPLPVSDRSILYLYGTAMLKFKRKANVTDTVFLATAPSNTPFPGDDVFVTTSEPSNRDLYRIGIGVNFLELFRGGFTQKPKQ